MDDNKYIDQKQRYLLPDDTLPVYLPIKSIGIHLYWEDASRRSDKTFDDVHEFTDFLKRNPVLAKAVGYVPKK
jgi:hypothetical protein